MAGVYMSEIALQELNRCLKCKTARCMKGCPVGTPVREAFELFEKGEIESAGKILFDNNPLSLICSYVCPHERQCEGSCVLSSKGMPIHVSSIEKYISNFYLDILNPEIPEKDHNKKVAIIGSGPSGITIAVILAQRGYDITMFELHDKIGGVLQYGIPEFRLPKEILQRLKVKLINMGIKLRLNIQIGTGITVDDMFKDGYKAVFIGTGVWRPKTLKIKGETLGHVNYAIDYLKNPASYNIGRKLCVIGAGNSAIDAARTAVRNGIHDVTIIYHKGAEDMSALKSEVEFAKFDGVKFLFYKKPVEITENGVILKDIIRKEDRRFEETDKLSMFSCDSVIVAIGQGPHSLIVGSTSGISVNPSGLVVTGPEGHTTREGVFSSGDVVTGAKTVVSAVEQSKKVADAIDKYVAELNSKNNK
ncbi:MAG: NAD(P)-dependent oxidoreductase [Bacillota bacterium]|nr:NAD(P)-dependent oxidoreductase [Bacillota bacterium]